jgi:hypothetical protein
MNDKTRRLQFSLIAERFSIVRLPPDAAIPPWAIRRAFFSVTRTGEELSVVTAASNVPEGFSQPTQWRALKVHGPFELTEVGVLAAITAPLADVGISIFVISTFDTDYLLVRSEQFRAAVLTLEAAGHVVEHGEPAVQGI